MCQHNLEVRRDINIQFSVAGNDRVWKPNHCVYLLNCMIIVLNCQIKLAVLCLVVRNVVVAYSGSSVVADLLEDLACFCKVNYSERIWQF
jgi:hypothetical protein